MGQLHVGDREVRAGHFVPVDLGQPDVELQRVASKLLDAGLRAREQQLDVRHVRAGAHVDEALDLDRVERQVDVELVRHRALRQRLADADHAELHRRVVVGGDLLVEEQPQQRGEAERRQLARGVRGRGLQDRAERLALIRGALGPTLRPQDAFESLLKLLARDAVFELAGDRQRHRARLFGDRDRDRIRLFGQADRRAVARAEALVDVRVLRQRQQAGRGHDAVVAHDHGAVVQRALGIEQRLDQQRRHFGVERRAGVRELLQRRVAFDRDQGAHAHLAHVLDRARDVLHDLHFLAEQASEHLRLAEVHDCAADLGVEHDDQRDDDRLRDRLEQVAQASEVHRPDQQHERDQAADAEIQQAAQHVAAARSAQEAEAEVDQGGEYRHLDHHLRNRREVAHES